ncbi:MAG: type II secretion system F family protein [Planctomycetales bacterium]|nr:type II secretion system F family protein [Planctomycetales bacterium]
MSAGSTIKAAMAPSVQLKSSVKSASSTASPSRRRAGLNRRELADFTSQLAVMTKTGLDVASALQCLKRLSTSERSRVLLEDLVDQVMSGQTLSKALSRHEKTFGPTYIATLAAGESSGALPRVLNELSHMLRMDVQLRTKVRGMLAYPVLLTSVSSLVVAALVLFVLPQFARIFEQQGTQLPMLTRALLAFSNAFVSYIWLWLPALLAIGGGLFAYGMTERGRLVFDRAKLTLPLVRQFVQRAYVARFCRLMGIMTVSGVSMLESLSILRRSIPNRVYRELIADVEENVMNGGSFSEPLVDAKYFISSAAEMLGTAERTGTIGPVSLTLAEHFEEEAESRLKEMLTYLEPALTLGLGFIVSLVVLSVTLPMFDMATFAK